MSKRLDIHASVDEIKELRLKEYELSWYPPREDLTKEGFFRLYTNATDAQKKSFAEKNPFIGKYQFKYDDYRDGGLWVRIRPLPVKSIITFQDEPYCYPECWDATPRGEMLFVYNRIITHGGSSYKEHIATWMRDVAPHIRNYDFKDQNEITNPYVNIAITERSEEEKIAYDVALKKAKECVEELKPEDIVEKEEIMYEEPIAVKPATGDYCLVVEDKDIDDVSLPIEIHLNKTDDEVKDLATNLLKKHNACVPDEDSTGRISIRELGKEIASVTCAVEVVHKTEWFRKDQSGETAADTAKSNGIDKGYTGEEAAAYAYTGGF